ncbi:MAG: hypothetical protein ACJA1A_000607 [Saprospiraceae bacterium]
MKQVLYISFLFVCGFSSFAQEISPAVSLIGDDEVGYEQTISECPSLLLEVAGNSMDSAYKLWTDMLADIETSSADAGVDLKGAKIWINLFWESDGSIKNIVYYPKPNSKNMDFSLVTNALEKFAANYNLPIDHTECFSHYGSASFPVHTKLATDNEK